MTTKQTKGKVKNMTTREKLIANMTPGRYYTSGQIKKMLCATQSTTADHLLMDAICAGYLQEGRPEGVNRVYRINQ